MKTVLRSLSDLNVLNSGSKEEQRNESNDSFITGHSFEEPAKEEKQESVSIVFDDVEETITPEAEIQLEEELEAAEQAHDEIEEAVIVAEESTDDSNNASVEELIRIMSSDDTLDEEEPYHHILDEPSDVSILINEIDQSLDEAAATLDQLETSIDTVAEVDPAIERKQIIAELRELFSIIHLPYNEALWATMPLGNLRDLLKITLANNGGSVEVSKILAETNAEYEKILSSDQMRLRMKLLDQKGADYAKVAATLQKMMGNDFSLKGGRSLEYHAMLKNAMMFVGSLSDKVMAMASAMGITIPMNEFSPNRDHIPIVEGMPSDPRTLMYVLNVFYTMIDKVSIQASYAKDEMIKQRDHIKVLEERLRRTMNQLEESSKVEQEIRSDYEARIRDSSFYMITDDHGRMVRKIDPEKPLETVADLDLRGTIDTALFLTSKSTATELADRLMNSRRFYNRTMVVKTVSIV